jgi:hypothetical protein
LLVETREVSSRDLRKSGSIVKQPGCLFETFALAVPPDRVLDLLFQNAARSSQLPQAVEVAEHRHVGIGGIVSLSLMPAGVAVGCLGGPHEREPGAAHGDLGVSPRRRDAEIEPGRNAPSRLGAGKEGVPTVEARRREDLRLWTREERLDLGIRPADGRRRGVAR